MSTTGHESMAELVHERIALAAIPVQPYRTLLSAWEADRRRQGGTPHQDLIDPFRVRLLTSSIVMFHVGPGLELTYRLVGESVRRLVTVNPVGRRVEEVVGTGAYGQAIAAQLRDCAAAGTPIYSDHHFRIPGEQVRRGSQRIALPYGDGSRVTRLLCYQIFSGDVEIREASLPSAEDWEITELAFVTDIG